MKWILIIWVFYNTPVESRIEGFTSKINCENAKSEIMKLNHNKIAACVEVK